MSDPATFRPAPVAGILAGSGERGTEAVRAAGWAAGWAAGSRAAAESARSQRARLEAATAAAENRRETDTATAVALLRRAAVTVTARTVPVLAAATAALHDGAVDLAGAVLGYELSDAGDRARAALDRALSLPPEVGVLTIRLHPTDLQLLVSGGVTADLPAGIELVADSALTPGDAVSEFPEGYLDARIGAALDRARRALDRGPR